MCERGTNLEFAEESGRGVSASTCLTARTAREMGRPARTSGSCMAPHTVMMPAQRQQHSRRLIDHLENGLADHLRHAGRSSASGRGGLGFEN